LAGVAAIVLGAIVHPETKVRAGSDAEKRGHALFSTKGCAHCHGPDGLGGGKGPDLQLVRKRRSRESMVTQIRDGGRVMPAFAGELSAQDIDDLVAFLRAKRKFVVIGPKTSEAPAQSAAHPTTN
jgi:ubiquinol-cytochrome c reductase cytochrome b subunit